MAWMRGKFTRSVAYRLFVSYAVILCIPVILSLIIYGQTREIVKREIVLASGAMLQQVRYIVDGELLQTESLAAQLAIHSDVRKLISSKTESAYGVYEMKQELNKLLSANDFIQGIYLYSKPLQTVLSSETYVKEQDFYEMKLQTDTFSYDSWQELINGEQTRGYVMLPVENQGNVVYTPAYVRSLTKQGSSETAGTLIIALNSEKIMTMLGNIDWVDRGQVLIMDTNSQVLIQNAGGNTVAPPLYREWSDRGTGTFTGSFEEVESMITIESSDTTGWKYISVFPTKVFWERVGTIRNLNLLGLLLCFVIGGAVITYFARKNYDPIRQLVSVFSRNTMPRSGAYLDEYTFIRSSVLETIRERDDMNNKQAQQLRVLKDYYLVKLLKGQTDRNVPLTELAKAYHLPWTGDAFAVMLFYIESSEDGVTDLALSQFIVSNIVADTAGDGVMLHFTDVDGMLAAVVNVHPEFTEQWKDDLEQDLAKAGEFILERYKLRFTAVGSELQSGLDGIHQAFVQALEAQEHRIMLGERALIWYGDIKPGESSYFFTVNDQMILINFLKAEEFGKAQQMISNVIGQAFQCEASHEMAKCVLLDLATTMIKTIPDSEQAGIAWEEWRPLKRLLSCSTKAEFEQELLDIFERVCGLLKSKQNNQANTGISEKIIDFVQKNYNDKNLSVALIGDEFRLTPQYVSRLFREQTGETGLHDYINHTRVEAAKLLLVEGVSIDETAARVGFASSHALIRVFKKYEGITPGKYRTIQEQA